MKNRREGAHRSWSPATRETAARACSGEGRLRNGVEEIEPYSRDPRKCSSSSSGDGEERLEIIGAPVELGRHRPRAPAAVLMKRRCYEAAH